MSELDWKWAYFPWLDAPEKQHESAVNAGYVKVVLKSEADNVIAELEESHKKEAEQLLIEIVELKETLKNSRNARKYWRKEYLIEYKECLHHKYKRCLAMAKLCKAEENRLEAISPIFDTDKECWEYNADYWFKWGERWLELAEKFKPNNEVNNA